jgi:predicted glycogen debranching enzyme
LRFDLKRPHVAIIASTERRDVTQASNLREAEIRRRKSVVASSPADDPFVRDLTAAADQYIVSRGDQKTVIAGYHWLSDWGRDTMIALPGLTLLTGKPEIARSILRTFAQYVDQGMLPNRFPDAGATPEYNTSMWVCGRVTQRPDLCMCTEGSCSPVHKDANC